MEMSLSQEFDVFPSHSASLKPVYSRQSFALIVRSSREEVDLSQVQGTISSLDLVRIKAYLALDVLLTRLRIRLIAVESFIRVRYLVSLSESSS